MKDADLDNRTAEKAKEFGTSKEVLQKELAKGGGLDRLRDMFLAESTLDYLIEKIKSVVRRVTSDERKK